MGIKTNVQQYTTSAAGDGECDPKQPAFHVTKEVWKEKKEREGGREEGSMQRAEDA